MTLIDGKAIAEKIKAELAKKAKTVKRTLAVILVGADPASEIYVGNKVKACEQVGIKSVVHRFDEKISRDELCDFIEKLNRDHSVHGILVQLPLPAHLNDPMVYRRVSWAKDVDGFHPANVGYLSLGEVESHIVDKPFIPCTALACLECIKSTGVPLKGAHAVVVGRSNIVGKPVAQLLLNHDCTVTVAHSHTKDLATITRQADILVVAVGKKHLITRDMVKKGAVVIDVGISRQRDVASGNASRIFGDVDFENVKDVAAYITPVPGGVGPLTVAMLLKNVLDCGE